MPFVFVESARSNCVSCDRNRILRENAVRPLEAWSSRIDLAGAIADIDTPKIRRNIGKAARCRATGHRRALWPRRTEEWRLEDQRQAAIGASSEPSRAARASGFRVL